MRVKGPGRPLATCPHPKNTCDCGTEKVVMVCIRKGRNGSVDANLVAECILEPKCICARAYPTGPDGMPMGPPTSFAAPVPSMSYALPTAPLAHPQTYRVQKPEQRRVTATTDPENVARGLERQKYLTSNRGRDLALSSESTALDVKPRPPLPYSNGSLSNNVDESLKTGHSCCQIEQQSKRKAAASINGAANTRSCCTQRSNIDPNISTTETTATQALAEKISLESPKTPPGKKNSKSLDNSRYPPESYSDVSSFSAQTTLYSIPPGYATARNPLNPEQLSELQHDPRFAQRVPEHAFHAYVGSSAPSAEGSDTPSMSHSCSCGPNCQCIACAAHPYNATTQGRVQDLLYSNPGEFRSSNSPSSQVSSEKLAFFDMRVVPASSGPNSTTQIMPLYKNSPNLGIEHPVEPNQFSQEDGTAYSQPTTYAELFEEQALPPLSFDDYYMYEYLVPEFNTCTAPAGSCRCGNDCTCVGCLTHTGHDDVWLEPGPVMPPITTAVIAASDSSTDNLGKLASGPSHDLN